MFLFLMRDVEQRYWPRWRAASQVRRPVVPAAASRLWDSRSVIVGGGDDNDDVEDEEEGAGF